MTFKTILVSVGIIFLLGSCSENPAEKSGTQPQETVKAKVGPTDSLSLELDKAAAEVEKATKELEDAVKELDNL